MSKDLALFDFDGTITTKDTFLEFIRFVKGNSSFFSGFLLLSPMLVLYKMKLFPNWRAKEITINYFFGGMPLEDFNQLCDHFIRNKLPSLIRTKAIEEIKMHQALGNPVWVVSASAENWISGWCKSNNIQLIATCLEVKDGKITGKIQGKNCYSAEKENRIRKEIVLKEYKTIWAYGDSAGDKELLALASKAHYKPFRK